jgi:hypothetical protein
MPPEKNLNKFYNTELKDQLRPLEQERKKLAPKGIMAGVFFGMAVILFFSLGANSAVGVFAFLFLLASIIQFIIFYNKKKKYVAAFKENIIRRIINFIDPSFQYKPGSSINEDDYLSSGLFLQHSDRYQGDDYIEGKKDKTFFCFSELHTQKRVNTGKSSHWVTIFKGLFFIGDFNKNFQSRTYVYSEKNRQLDFFSKLFSSFASGLEKVKLESIEFEKRFIVYGADQVEARYILTPSMMERMVKLEEMMGSGISFSFVKTNIYVAVPVRHALFEPSVYSENSIDELTEYYNTVQIVFDIIDELKLNERLWNKE